MYKQGPRDQEIKKKDESKATSLPRRGKMSIAYNSGSFFQLIKSPAIYGIEKIPINVIDFDLHADQDYF